MKTIRLYGELGKRFGREFTLDVRSPGEAVQALCSQIKGFRQYFFEHANDYYKVFVGGRSLREDEVTHPSPDQDIIRIAPSIQGAGGAGKIILGAALIVASFYLPTTALIGSMSWSSLAGNVGISLLLGGVAEMLAPSPSKPTSAEAPNNRPSYLFNGAVNTVTQGNPVPLCYGRLIVGSQVISAGLVTE